ncbi:uncharacterized protein N7498_006078 [Penicillium cinerascens]|uniref:Uncharacterized protein n=1 Tax=Penicillium cinerascens TaxID=70096 RepID=A0A9W9MHK2_9EURO|nr:uncharacterized protein N7498_006078 [Penicillium cinerascens]KAJ5201415.1 hypothetical protein N7498_006078 [Penicillium cinerascens]
MLDTQVGKRNVVIDLKSVEGKLEFRALLEERDVLLDKYRPGVIGRMGFGMRLCGGGGGDYVCAGANVWVAWGAVGSLEGCWGLDESAAPLLLNSDYQTGVVGAIGITHALYQRVEEEDSCNVDTSLNQFNNRYLDLTLHEEEAVAPIKAKDLEFKVLSHDTDLFTLVSMTKQSLRKSHGSGKDELFDPPRFTVVEMC